MYAVLIAVVNAAADGWIDKFGTSGHVRSVRYEVVV